MAARSIEMRGARLALARRRRKPRHQCDKQMGSSAWDHTGPGDAQQAGHCRCGDIAPGRGPEATRARCARCSVVPVAAAGKLSRGCASSVSRTGMNNREWVRTDGMALVRGDDLIMYVSVCVCVCECVSLCLCMYCPRPWTKRATPNCINLPRRMSRGSEGLAYSSGQRSCV